MNPTNHAPRRMRWARLGRVPSRVRAEQSAFDWLCEELELASRTQAQLVTLPRKTLGLIGAR